MIEVGQVEGFAHFFAGDVLNNDGQSNCSFSYYKEFRLPSGTEITPPYIISCYNQVRWMENHCSAGQADQGTEYDWMGFFWHLNNGGTSSQDLSYDEIETVWQAQCSGSVCFRTDTSDDAPWDDLEDAADSELSLTKSIFFTDTGDDFGVNH